MSIVPLIASAARARGIPLLLAGGHAVIAHGYARSTFDLDVIARREDREQWVQTLDGLNFTLHREGPAFIQFNPPNPDTFPVDIMLVSHDTFAKLWVEAGAAPVWPDVKIVSLMNLLALKCHAVKHGHAGRVVKDADDVIRLIQINGLDPESERLRELFLRHATEEFYDKVRRACRPG